MKTVLGVLLLALATLVVRAEDDLPDAAAATEIIERLQGTLGDLSTVLALPPEKRKDWVLKQAAQRVQKKLADDATEGIKEAMGNYAKAAFRADAFKTIALPALKNAAVMKVPVDWELLESRMNSKVDTKLAAYGAAVAGAALVWDSVEAFSEKGAQAGFARLATGLYETVADAYIPGWGWFKLGLTMVEGLGNFVLGYATDTATEGMLNDIFSMKSDPQGFAEMLRNTPLPEINRQVDEDWELVAYGRLWNGQGTDAGDDAMKQRLKDTVYNLKAAVAREYAEQQRKDAELRARFQPYLDAAAQAEAKLSEITGKVVSDARPLLAATRDFQRRSNELLEEQSVVEAQAYNAAAIPAAGEELQYVPIPRGGFIPLTIAAYDMLQEGLGGSFDEEAFYAAIKLAGEAIHQAKISQPIPPDGWGKPAWLIRQEADLNAIAAETMVIAAAGRQREAVLAQALRQEIDRLGSRLNTQSEILEQGLVALENEAVETLRIPDTFRRHGFPPAPDFTQDWLANNQLARPQSFSAANYARIASYVSRLESDLVVLQDLNSRRRKLYGEYNLFLLTVENKMREIIPQGCLIATNGVVGSEKLYKTWGSSYAFGGLSLTLRVSLVRPELTEVDFVDSKRAILVAKTRLAELEADHDRWQLQQALQRVTKMLDEKFLPFQAGKPGSQASGLVGRVDGILNYREPVERTDLYLYTQQFESVWLAAQSRLELLGRHPTLVDAAPYLQWGIRLKQYQSTLAADRSDRARAPAQADSLKSTVYQPAIGRWTPIFMEMTPDYYEEALGGLGSMLASAEGDYLRALAGTTPAILLLRDYLRSYIPQLTNLMSQAQAEYTRIAPWYSKVMPSISTVRRQVSQSVGQDVHVAFEASHPGGSYSAPFLPAGLSMDPSTGTLRGRVTQAGDFEICVRYLSALGVSTHTMVQLGVTPPAPATPVLTINNGSPEISLLGVEGISYTLQVRDGLANDTRWVTVKTLGGDQRWTDAEGLEAPSKFYRLTWVQPLQ